MIRACLYARFSTDGQREVSIDDQYRECERVARAAGLHIVARFGDKAISAGTATRPGYQQQDISRLWRNRAEFGPRSAESEDLGINCLTCVGDDTRRDGWGLVIQIKHAVAEHARREASYRTKRGLECVARAGKHAGGRGYGYIPAAKSPTGQIEVDPEQSEVVRSIFSMYGSGHSPKSIAAELNRRGLPSPGSMWKRIERRRSGWLGSAIAGMRRVVLAY